MDHHIEAEGGWYWALWAQTPGQLLGFTICCIIACGLIFLIVGMAEGGGDGTRLVLGAFGTLGLTVIGWMMCELTGLW